MKFARYLQDTQIPEWKKAYIDYRALKVQLSLIRAQTLSQGDRPGLLGTSEIDQPRQFATNNEETHDEFKEVAQGNTTSARTDGPWASSPNLAAHSSTAASGQVVASPVRRRTSNQERPFSSLAVVTTVTPSAAPPQQILAAPLMPRPTPGFTFFRDSLFRGSVASSTQPSLHEILFNLPPAHKRFFDMLDAELEKVESFYVEREKEMRTRADKFKAQFDELGVHRQMFYRSSARARTKKWAKKTRRSVPPALSNTVRWLQGPDDDDAKSKPSRLVVASPPIVASESGRGRRHGVDASNSGTMTERVGRQRDDRRVGSTTNKEETPKDEGVPSRSNANSRAPLRRSDSLSSDRGAKHPTLNPHEYQHAKRRLRRAVIEHYRGLEALNNYRILNLTGFRKALKKYEKITKNPILDAYFKEKVEPSTFADGAMVLSTMLKETEDLFAMRFEHGDRKRAIARLRVEPSKMHHFSAFRSGLWLGLALPAISSGLYLSLQEDVRQSLPSWNILLYIYSILLPPVLLSLLIGINIAVWAREKINYVFIFDLNPRSRLDNHEYFELSSFFLFTLASTFWFSMAQLGSPLLWPLLWLAFVLVIMLNPLRRFMWGPARWWIVKTTVKLGASGLWKVEFADFWLGDQFCSLHYSLSNLFFVGCFYSRFYVPMAAQTNIEALSSASPPNYNPSYAQEAWSTCGVVRNWGWYYALGILPFMVRFLQSLRRYRDSKLPTHLINAGKYTMGMIYYFFYFSWRHRESPHGGVSYVLWCFTASAYAIYGCAWDFLMDWSLCKPHAQHPFLRPELIFKTQIPSYYVALITNLCIRFVWLVYVPPVGPTGLSNMAVRSFIASVLEILRRVQWNFYRLENEHLGNMDQYRVTREVPLPYSFEVHSNDENEQEENDGDEDGDGDGDENENENEQGHEQREVVSAGVPWWKVWAAAAGPKRHGAGHG